MVKRMLWTWRENGDQVSECGRFVIRRTCSNPKWWGYWSLYDTTTETEFPCRSEDSAKTAARNILRAPPCGKLFGSSDLLGAMTDRCRLHQNHTGPCKGITVNR